MRFVRFAIGSTIGYGLIEEESLVRAISTTPFLPWEATSETFSISEVRLLAPCLPSKVVAVGLNYKAHAEETGATLPAEPMLFLKPSTAVIGPHEKIHIPAQSQRVDYEGELAVVIGKLARRVAEDAVDDVVLGYTCANDVTARDLQGRDGQWGRAKGFDTFCPLGPEIVTGLDGGNLAIETRVNGETKQSSRTSDLIFGIPKLVSFVSSIMTLLPGDVIITGTPAGIGPLKPGDTVEVEIEGIDVLENTVA